MRLLVCASSLGMACACTDDDSRVEARAEDLNAPAIESIEVHASNIAEGVVVEGTVRLGTIELGQVGMDGVHCRFHVRNMTDTPLERVRLVPSCGCTQAVAMQESIAPGETLTVDVRLSPRVAGEQWSEVGILATPGDRTVDRIGEQAPAPERPVACMRIAWMGAARFRLALASSAVSSEGLSPPRDIPRDRLRWATCSVVRFDGRSRARSCRRDRALGFLGAVAFGCAGACTPASSGGQGARRLTDGLAVSARA